MKLFSMEGPVISVLNKAADLFILNIIFLITCIPIVTIGASMSALYYVTLKMARNEEGYIFRSFFRAFKENFRQATTIWVPSLLMLVVLFFDIRIANQMNSPLQKPLIIGAYFILLILLLMLLFVFPVLAKFENTVRQTVKNALLMSIGNLPFTICILVLTILPPVLITFLPPSLSFIYVLWFFCGCSLTALGASYIFEFKIFKKYIPSEQE